MFVRTSKGDNGTQPLRKQSHAYENTRRAAAVLPVDEPPMGHFVVVVIAVVVGKYVSLMPGHKEICAAPLVEQLLGADDAVQYLWRLRHIGQPAIT